MDPQQLEKFRKRLEKERDDLIALIHEMNQDIARDNADDRDPDPMDAATTLVNQGELLGKVGQLEEILARVENALARIDEGTYGISEVSGKPIPIERLEALPYATTLAGEDVPGIEGDTASTR